jgi:hypothetical protein
LESVVQVGIGLIIAVATAWLTVQFSIHQFRQEKWWERRYEAYNSVVEALGEIHFELNKAANSPDGSYPRDAEAIPRAFAKMIKVQLMNRFLMSKDMNDLLLEFSKNMNPPPMSLNPLEVVAGYIAKVSDIARRDLSLPVWK